MASIHERAKGRWREILVREFGVAEKLLDGNHHTCPGCGAVNKFRLHKDKDKADDGVYFCRNDVGSGMDLVMHISGLGFAAAAARVENIVGKDSDWRPERKKSIAERVMELAEPLRQSAYLRSRGIVEPPPGLYCVRRLDYYEDGKVVGAYPAILAPLTRDGKLVTVQATYLHGGRKAPVPHPKKTLPGAYETINGASVVMRKWAGGDEPLGFAEGVETAISASIMWGVPVRACLSTSGLKSVLWPSGLKRAIVFADNDESLAGHAAAWQLAHRLKVAGVSVKVVFPPEPGTDWNDVLLERLK